MILSNTINIILIGVIVLCLVAFAIILFLLIWGICSSEDKNRREKFGSNYERAISNEFADVECEPYQIVVSKKLIDEKYCPNITLPDFQVIKCVSHMRHFTGDTSETVEIEFVTLPDQTIFSSCEHVTYIYTDIKGVRHAVIRYDGASEQMQWSIDIPENSLSAKISYLSM